MAFRLPSQKHLVIFITLLLLVVLFGFAIQNARAETADELQQKINQKNSDIDALEKEIAQYEAQLTTLAGQKDTLTKAIQELDLNAKKLAADIKITESKINATNLKLQSLSSTIADKSDSITLNEATIKKTIVTLFENDNQTLIEKIMTQDSLGDAWKYIDEIANVRAQITAHVVELRNTKKDLETKKIDVEKTKAELATLQANLSNQKKVIDQNTRDKNTLLKTTKNQQSSYATLVAQKKALKDQFAKDLDSYESQLRFVLDPSSIPKAGGVFSWPVDNVKITQLFGKTSASGRLYASGTHNGVDFGVPIGTPAKAVLSGTVLGSGNTDLTCPGASYGNWILIRHDNGLTSVFGHLSLVTAHTGDRVATGQIVAYSGSTGYSTGPHLHISVFASSGVEIKNVPSKTCGGKVYTQPVAAATAYLDPMLYFPKYTGVIY